jgi:hypothetical protein
VQELTEFAERWATQGKAFLGLAALLPEDAHQTTRLSIGVTDADTGAPALHREWTSRDGLLESIRASCHIPKSWHPLSRTSATPGEGRAVSGFPGQLFTDGALSRAFPSASDLQEGAEEGKMGEEPGGVFVVSPFSGPTTKMAGPHRLICPERDTSWGIGSTTVRGGLPVHLNLGNARMALRSAGIGASPGFLSAQLVAGRRHGQAAFQNSRALNGGSRVFSSSSGGSSSNAPVLECVLSTYPGVENAVSPDNFTVQEQPTPRHPLDEGQLRLEAQTLSVDPYIRCRLDGPDHPQLGEYIEPIPLGMPVDYVS